MNYFEFYGIPVSFVVEAEALRRIFYRKSKQYHPDFHTLAGEEEQADMLDLSSLNNEAYKTLSDPDRRMRYILEINGLLGNENKQTPLPQDFLMDMMDINEALMELEMDPDAARYAETLNEVEQIENQLNTSIKPVLDVFVADENGIQALPGVRDFYLKKRYLLRIRENLSKFASAF